MSQIKRPTSVRKPGAVNRFEEIIAWQKGRALAGAVYLASRSGSFARDYAFCSQIQKAAVSVMANIAEGAERLHSKEFHQFLSVAKASCAEVRSHLYLALDIGYIDPTTFERLMAQADETARVIGGLRASIARRLTG
jgi:four helix bundle protein